MTRDSAVFLRLGTKSKRVIKKEEKSALTHFLPALDLLLKLD